MIQFHSTLKMKEKMISDRLHLQYPYINVHDLLFLLLIDRIRNNDIHSVSL